LSAVAGTAGPVGVTSEQEIATNAVNTRRDERTNLERIIGGTGLVVWTFSA
jgi:hypothetical protein